MAKRRNQKKEKALRNRANARKYRKKQMTGRYNRRSGPGGAFEDNDTGAQAP
ncbi:hypothetical protein [Gloeobacter kilaueensis]|uniref:Uncharacterized protein n=1 Tax=Gloeobacter kilaueensis (strain ATCC BAA-2537 / CCAP 1431/1 / ULC 316 / JS1) TaxID=1183438 RepID=U5QL24_GLOK1|nr:hypothetical protein [Gloeobacter kilaueensis]AGY59692.1 hypothetical protein GKIL_3446 [Gloeobacter kilaueensis JS1]